MSWVDPQGRFFGKVSVVDLTLVLFLAALSPVAVYGYRLSQPRPPRVTEIRPRQIPAGGTLQIQGMNFTPQSRVWLGGLPAAGIQFYGSDLLVVYLPRKTPPGPCAVSVKNPDGLASPSGTAVEILPAIARPKVPVILTVAFEGLDRDTADRLERKSGPSGKNRGSAPKLLRILKRGPMDRMPKKESLLADVLLLSEVESWEGAEHYYYRGQPLQPNFQIPLRIGGETFTAVIYRDPRPTRLNKG